MIEINLEHLILPIAIIALLFVSCDKDNGSAPKNSSGAVSYEVQDWNRNKQPDGLQIDTAWDGDTTIYF